MWGATLKERMLGLELLALRLVFNGRAKYRVGLRSAPNY
jgi:hypothetical protein